MQVTAPVWVVAFRHHVPGRSLKLGQIKRVSVIYPAYVEVREELANRLEWEVIIFAPLGVDVPGEIAKVHSSNEQ